MITKSEARKSSGNLATRKRRMLDQLEIKKSDSKQRQSTFENYLINQKKTES